MILFMGDKFDEIEKFDCRIIDLKYKAGGSFFTALPISPLDYRLKHGSRSNVSIENDGKFTHFHITDDWGTLHKISIENIHEKEIKTAIKSAKIQKLFKMEATK